MGKYICCVVPTFIFRVLGGILSVSIDTAYDVKCVDHRLVQDLGSSPGTLFGCAPVCTQGPSHERLWETQQESQFEIMENQREIALMNTYAYMHFIDYDITIF